MSRKTKALEFANVSYNVDVMGKNVQVTDAMKAYAEEKVAKIERFSHKIIDVSVVLEVQRFQQSCDITLKVDHLKIKSHAETDDMYASIDKAVEKMETQLRRYRDRLKNHHTKSIEEMEVNVNVLEKSTAFLNELNEEIDLENEQAAMSSFQPPKIVKNETMTLKFLTQEEALMKMELSKDPFLIFKAEADRKIKVMYRRKDGHFAVIEPEI